MLSWLNKLTKVFNSKNKKIDNVQKDNLLLYPYIDEDTIASHPLIDEYNLTRLYSIQNYLNEQIHKSNRHINLKPFFEQNEKLHWIGVVSDIKRPKGENIPPVLLIDKFAQINNSTAKLLDNHVWLNTKYIKLLENPTQTIAIGEAIQGTSIIGSYHGKDGVEKYGLRETILKGSGIFTGSQPRNDQITDLSSNFVTDFDRHNDWILKLANNQDAKVDLTNQREFNRLFTLPGHVKIRYQDSNINNYIGRQIGKKKEEERHRRQAQQNSNTTIIQKAKRSLTIKRNPAIRYYGEFLHYGYINDHEGKFIPLMILKNITDELNKPVANKFLFILDDNIINIGQLTSDEKIIFTTRSTKPTDADHYGKIASLKPINNQTKRAKLPLDRDTLIGFIMYDKNDQSIEHLPFLEKYRVWATKNHITLPKQENRKLINLKSKQDLLSILKINENRFNQLTAKLLIKPKYISDNVPYYDQKAIKKLEQEIHLNTMLQNMKKHKSTKIDNTTRFADSEKRATLPNLHAILETSNGSYYYENFDTLTDSDIKNKILKLSSYSDDLYLKVFRVSDNKKAFICVKDISSFQTMSSDKAFHL